MMTPYYWADAITHLSHTDKVIQGLINAYPDAIPKHQGNAFQTLLRAVVGQQISVKVAEATWKRLETRLEVISPTQWLTLRDEQLRECGLSRQKIEYLRVIADAFEQKKLIPSQWQQMSDQEVMAQLMAIKGIGKWTAQMFLIFYLQRPDVLPLADLGLLKAIERYYGRLSLTDIHSLAQQWQPYRTVASLYLWRSLDPIAVAY